MICYNILNRKQREYVDRTENQKLKNQEREEKKRLKKLAKMKKKEVFNMEN